MPAQDNLYSLFVSWSKILLPMAGIGLLSVMFLFARDTGPAPSIPFAEIEEIAREARISDPRFSTVTASGATVALSADSIRPDPQSPSAFAVTEMRAEIDAADGGQIIVSAGMGQIDPDGKIARISGLARLTSSTGYVMETEGLIADLSTGTIRSLGDLAVRTPYGDLDAGGLEVTITEDGTAQRLVFNDGVRLLYTPQP